MDLIFYRLFISLGIIWLTQTVFSLFTMNEKTRKVIIGIVIIVAALWFLAMFVLLK